MQRLISLILFLFVIFINSNISILADDTNENESVDNLIELDLETALSTAIAQNPSISAIKERIKQARERVNQARADYWPRLDINGSSYNRKISDNAYWRLHLSNPNGVDDEAYYSAEFKATWILFDGFERRYNTFAAKYGSQETQAVYWDSLRMLLKSISQAFYNAQLAQEYATIARANRTFYNGQLKEAKIRHQVGTGSLSDALSFEIQSNSAKAEVIISKQNYDIALIGLATLMGARQAQFLMPLKLAQLKRETFDELVVPEAGSIIEYAKKNRPDLMQKKFARNRTEANIKKVYAGFFPSINLYSSLYGERINSGRFEGDDFERTIGVTLTYNIFSGGKTKARLREEVAKRVEAEKELETFNINIVSDILKAFSDLRSAKEQLELQRLNADLVEKNRDLVKKEYDVGHASLVRLNEAQRDLVTSQSKLASSLVSLRMAWQDLRASSGEILEPYLE